MEESVNTRMTSSTDPQGNTLVVHTAGANVSQGQLQVRYSENNGTPRADLTLDRDRDGQSDFTLSLQPQGGSLAIGAGGGVMQFTAEQAQHLLKDIRDIVTTTDISLYRGVADFLIHPGPDLAHAPSTQSRGK